MNKNIYPVLGCLTAVGMVLASPSFAAKQVVDAPQASGKLEEIIVTAQKRKENLQSVPIAVTAVSAAQLRSAGITNAQDLPVLVSGLIIQQNSDNLNVYLRGIGNPASLVGNESSVAVYLDGVYYSRLAPGFLELNNVQGVDVLKGPQGTLFGRNADAGMIQITTKDPSHTPTLHIDVGYGNYDTFTGNLYASTGIGDKIAADIAIHDQTMGGAWGTNLANGEPFGWANALAIRSKWVLTPTDDTKVTVALDYSDSTTTQGGGYGGLQAAGSTHGAPLTPGVALPAIPFYDADTDGFDGGKDLGFGASVKAEHDFSFAKLVSITALRKMTGAYIQDADFSPQNFFEFLGTYWQQQTTQEFQLISQKGSRFDWTVGAFYMNLHSEYNPARFTGPEWQGAFLLPEGEFDVYGEQTVNTAAAYTQETFHILDHTDITGGLRYTEDQVSGSGHNNVVDNSLGVNVNTGYVKNHKNYEKLTYRMALDHHFDDNTMGYISYNRGFKAGTYNLLPFSPDPVAPEVLDAYEFGAKSELFDHHLRLNVALFYDQVRNLQVQTFVGPTLVLVNAGAAESKGIDLDGQAVLSNRLTAHFSATLLDADYTSFPGAPYSMPAPSGVGTVVVPRSATGKSLPEAPTLSFAVGLAYHLPTPIGDWELASNYSFATGYGFNPDGEVHNSPFGLLDARATYVLPGNEHWRFSVWGKNLTGEEYYIGDVEEGTANGNPVDVGAPRTFGVSVSYDM